MVCTERSLSVVVSFVTLLDFVAKGMVEVVVSSLPHHVYGSSSARLMGGWIATAILRMSEGHGLLLEGIRFVDS